MGPRLRGFTREGLLKRLQNQGTGPEVAALGKGTEMTLETGTPGRKVGAEAGRGLTVTGTVQRTEIIVDGAGVAVPVLITQEDVVEAVMMMSDQVAADPGIVSPLGPPLGEAWNLEGVIPHVRLPRVRIPL
uniref:Uncharacterized protein n=1 Tax=Salix viminalis TaxID=40686 RepID=A0A6N2KE95_SALVM